LATNSHILSNVMQETGLEEEIDEGKKPFGRP
jgi:hypothetical protein